jgi:hypothetical protein
MGCLSCHAGKETSRAEPPSSVLPLRTDFFFAEHLEAAARQTGFVPRPSQMTGHSFLALVTFGVGGTPRRRWRHGPRKARHCVRLSRCHLQRLITACTHARWPFFKH